jgi:hypothetical protein
MNSNDFGGLGSLLDVSFSRFITSKLVSILYVLFLAFVGLGLIVTIFGALIDLFQGDFGSALLQIILAPIGALVAVVIARVYLELIIVIFKIAENTRAMVEKQEALLRKD